MLWSLGVALAGDVGALHRVVERLDERSPARALLALHDAALVPAFADLDVATIILPDGDTLAHALRASGLRCGLEAREGPGTEWTLHSAGWCGPLPFSIHRDDVVSRWANARGHQVSGAALAATGFVMFGAGVWAYQHDDYANAAWGMFGALIAVPGMAQAVLGQALEAPLDRDGMRAVGIAGILCYGAALVSVPIAVLAVGVIDPAYLWVPVTFGMAGSVFEIVDFSTKREFRVAAWPNAIAATW